MAAGFGSEMPFSITGRLVVAGHRTLFFNIPR